MKNCKR